MYKANTKPQTLPAGIEIFRAGRHTDDAGNVHEFSEQDIADMAASYQPELSEAPLTIGHPKDNLPAYGWVQRLVKAGANLLMDSHQVEPQFAEMVSAKRFKKRSASFYPPQSPNNPTPGKWYLRHVAFLGAQPPAIKGLKDFQFSESADEAVSFSEAVASSEAQPHPNAGGKKDQEIDMTEEEKKALEAKLAAAEADKAKLQAEKDAAEAKATAAQAQATSFAEKAKADRNAGFVSFAETQVKAGNLLPKDQAVAVATMERLADAADGAPVEFAEGNTTHKVDPVQWLQSLITSRAAPVQFGEFAPAHLGTGVAPGSAAGKSDAEIDAAAQAYAKQHKVDYAEALSAVTFTA